jgi:hypothetical protein
MSRFEDVDPHRLAELRSLALHEAIGDKLMRTPSLIDVARRRLETRETTAPHYRDEWLAVLAQPLESIVAFLGEDSERGRALRQSTPFAGVIEPRERWRIWRSVREGA